MEGSQCLWLTIVPSPPQERRELEKTDVLYDKFRLKAPTEEGVLHVPSKRTEVADTRTMLII